MISQYECMLIIQQLIEMNAYVYINIVTIDTSLSVISTGIVISMVIHQHILFVRSSKIHCTLIVYCSFFGHTIYLKIRIFNQVLWSYFYFNIFLCMKKNLASFYAYPFRQVLGLNCQCGFLLNNLEQNYNFNDKLQNAKSILLFMDIRFYSFL